MKSRLEQLLDELLRQIDIPAMEQAMSKQYKSQIRRRWELPADYPYTILFNLSGDRPELCKERNRLQLRKSGYSLKVDHNMLMLFTWPILEQFTPEKVKDLIYYYRVHKKPMIELANGWYHIEILGGETLQDGAYEPTFEFVIQPATNEEATINADMNFSFEITSSAY